ncbi:MAG: sigma-54-dependent Fis family transcriptional regulator [Clostridia bacterium]|nr:sigma-54-dependent Fis family transcriptional regulator [Clostridia bacterium]
MKSLTVLVVEDEIKLLNLLERIIANEGYHVKTAKNGFEALEIIDSHTIDIVLTDIKMPGMDGIELLTTIKTIDSSIEVILMTAFATVETAVDALKKGARDYIRKPFDIEEIIDAIQKTSLLLQTELEKPSGTLHADEMLTANSRSMQELLKIIHKVAHSLVTISIQGETGVGKELVARAIHALSDRANQPFITVNCSALPETLLESELFGYEKGAFTGAFARKLGRFELANKGTIFLDEIGDISPLIQLKLLRILQERELERLGSTETIHLDIRIITATNKDLAQLVESGDFREDLFYRLNVIPMAVPSLRERAEDIPALIKVFMRTSMSKHHIQQKELTPEALEILLNYPWPGNVRELENIIERILVISEGDTITVDDLPNNIRFYNLPTQNPLNSAIESVEENAIRATLDAMNGNVTKAAEKLGISRRSLHRKINKFNIHHD